MKTFTQFITEQLLQEKLIVLNNGKPYGQICFLVGGGGSGKGFALENFIDSESYKVRDVDAMKLSLLALEKNLSKVRGLPDCQPGEKSAEHNLDVMKCNPFADIRNLDLRNPKHVFELHQFMDVMGLKDTTLRLMLQASLISNHDRTDGQKIFPNILFDMTGKNIKTIRPVIEQLLTIGYHKNDIHIVWVLADYSVAVERNKNRERIVPDDVLLDTHEGAANTMHNILINGAPHDVDGGIYVILNRDLRKKDEIDPKTGEMLKSDFYTDGKTVRNFDYVQVKRPGEPLNIEKEKEKLQQWIVDNIPRSAATQHIIDRPLERR